MPKVTPSEVPPLTIHGGKLLNRLRVAAEALLGEHGGILKRLEIGWTSIPIVNACAVRRGDATAIALNVRLNNLLGPATFLGLAISENMAMGRSDEAHSLYHRLLTVLRAANQPNFDDALAKAKPFPSFKDFRWSLRLAQVQLVFVLMHECAHIALGHLDKPAYWEGHPLSDDQFAFLSGSANAEFEADEFAARMIMDHSKWPSMCAAVSDALYSLFDSQRPANWLVPVLLILLFVWLHAMTPTARNDYYKIPRSHPHPFDRADRILALMQNSDDFFDKRSAQTFRNVYFRWFETLEPT